MKKSKITPKLIILLILITVLSAAVYFIPKLTGYVIQEEQDKVKLYFYDELTSCPLEGYVFIGDTPIGKTTKGLFNLTYPNYVKNFKENKNISIFGRLGNCFDENSTGLLFDKYFIQPAIGEYNFLGESLFEFKTKIDSNNPSNKELIGFIQSEKVKPVLNNIILNKEDLDDLSAINKYLSQEIVYLKDWDFDKEINYWQTPLETLSLKTGDCEDYSTALLSLFLAHNPSLNCYNIIFTSHVTTLCQIEDEYVYYDQQKTELSKKINKEQYNQTILDLSKFNQDYFKYYGINESETKPFYAFNDNQFIAFNNEQEFLSWQYSLNEKDEFNLFEVINRQIFENIRNLPDIQLNEGELRSETISLPSSATSMPLKLLMIGAVVVLVILIILLIRLLYKKR